MSSGPLPVRYVSASSPVVELSYSDLSSSADLSASIDAAFGKEGLGLLVVRGVPEFSAARATLLPLAQTFAQLPDSTKRKYEHPQSHYSFGWSHGKEVLAGKPDLAKGSYYNNPLHDVPFPDRPDLAQQYPAFCAPNIWPTGDVPELENAFKTLGKIMLKCGAQLAKHCDRYVHSKCPDYPPTLLEDIIVKSKTHKARLLHYFPVDSPSTQALLDDVKTAAAASLSSADSSCTSPASASKPLNDDDFGSWCGWHNDHGSLTALCSALYLSKSGTEVPNPDPSSGLYAKSRSGAVIKMLIPSDCLAFQLGESEQIHSGGFLQATPHCVHTGSGDLPAASGVSRNTFALFMEPEFSVAMRTPKGRADTDATFGSSHRFLPKGVPELEKRWKNTMDFGQFTKSTLDAYYPQEKDENTEKKAVGM